MKVGAVIQARNDSKRFPGKVLMPLPYKSNQSILAFLCCNLSQVNALDEIIIATSTDQIDDAVSQEAKTIGVHCFRGSKENVLDRYLKTSETFNLDVIVRLTGDNPFVFTHLMDDAIIEHINCQADYTRNIGLPLGTSFEVVSKVALKRSDSLGPSLEELEHVTLFIKNHAELFSINQIQHELDDVLLGARFTIDYPSDYAMVNLIASAEFKSGKEFNIKQLSSFVETNAWVKQINTNHFQKREFKSQEDEILAAIEVLGSLGMEKGANALRESTRR